MAEGAPDCHSTFVIRHLIYFSHYGLGISHFPSGSFCGVKSVAWPGTLYS
jgi:hypothetical protein